MYVYMIYEQLNIILYVYNLYNYWYDQLYIYICKANIPLSLGSGSRQYMTS